MKVLLVDPDTEYRRLLAALVVEMGYSTYEASTAEEADGIVSVQPLQVVLTEWNLPDHEGLWLIQRLSEHRRAGRRATPVVLTAKASREQVLAAVQAGVGSFLLKPELNVRRLSAALAHAFGRVPAETNRLEGGTPHQAVTVASGNGRPAAGPPVPGSAHDPGTPAPDGATSLGRLRPIVTRSSVLDRLKEIEQVRAMSPTVTQVVQLTSDSATSLAAVTKVISRDQSVALKILRLANSSVFARGDPVTSVHEAVVRIGMDQIRDAVMNLAVIDQFTSTIASERFNFMHFWEHSIACGLIAAELGAATGSLERGRAFTLGLLHDVGRMVLVEHFAPEYTRVLEEAERLDLPLEQVESRLLLLNHADIMDRLLHMWGFPRDLVLPLAHHHLSAPNLRQHAVKQLGESAVLALANRLAHAIMIGSSGNEAVYPTESLCRLLNLSGEQVSLALERAEAETHKVKFALLMVGDSQPWPPVLERHRAGLREPIRALYVTLEPGLDAFELALARLGTGTDAANVIVARVEAARNAPAVAARVQEADEGLEGPRLPLLILSPNGDLGLPGTAAEGRTCLRLGTPLTIARLIGALNTATAAGSSPEAPEARGEIAA